MLRSAAKNFAAVTTVVDPADYAQRARRRSRRATTISTCAAGSPRRCSSTRRRTTRRSRRGSRRSGRRSSPSGSPPARARAGAALRRESRARRRRSTSSGRAPGSPRSRRRAARSSRSTTCSTSRARCSRRSRSATQPCCAIVKHTTPCGLATGADALEAYRKALACDPVSAFGSVISFTVPVDDAAAEAVSSLFVECVVAPSFSDGALEILGRKKNLRVLEGRARWSTERARLQARARRAARAGASARRRSTTARGAS